MSKTLKEFKALPMGLQLHLLAHEEQLKARAAYQRRNSDWWRFTWPLHKEHMHRRKLLCPYLAGSNRFSIDDEGKFLGLTDTTVLYDAGQVESLRYFLGLLNSKLLTFRFRHIGKLKSAGVIEYFWNSLSDLSIRRIRCDVIADQNRHDQIVFLVTQLEDLQEKSESSRVAQERIVHQHRIAAVEAQIDRLVYDLYGLTTDEIAIVEQTLSGEQVAGIDDGQADLILDYKAGVPGYRDAQEELSARQLDAGLHVAIAQEIGNSESSDAGGA